MNYDDERVERIFWLIIVVMLIFVIAFGGLILALFLDNYDKKWYI